MWRHWMWQSLTFKTLGESQLHGVAFEKWGQINKDIDRAWKKQDRKRQRKTTWLYTFKISTVSNSNKTARKQLHRSTHQLLKEINICTPNRINTDLILYCCLQQNSQKTITQIYTLLKEINICIPNRINTDLILYCCLQQNSQKTITQIYTLFKEIKLYIPNRINTDLIL